MKLKILENAALKSGHFLLSLAAPRSFLKARPGQFLHIRVADSNDPLLRRPLSIHDVFPARRGRSAVVKIFYKVVGRGTQVLSRRGPSEDLDVLGPRGSGFRWEEFGSRSSVYIVAGGMGVAPLFFLAKKLAHGPRKTDGQDRSAVHRKIVVLLGAKTKDSVFCEKEFKKLGCAVHVATEDGSRGLKGKVTDLFKETLAASCKRQASGQGKKNLEVCDVKHEAVVCACGPKPMLAGIAEIAREAAVPAYVSLEEFMGCGLGACLGCVIRTTSGYRRICHDGPVCPAQEIIWKG